jgi:putative nucleotidyltransferase with HDIG domain
VYSADELVGVSFISGRRIHHDLRDLKEDLEKELAKNNIASGLRLVYLKYKKSYAVRDLLFMLSSEIKKFKEDFLLLTEAGLAKLFASSGAKIKESGKLLESLDADIEERNLQLLSLIENLTLEHGRTKEAFYQIITSLVAALEARDTYTEGHSERVSRYALMLAEKLGWPKEEKEKLRKAALLHDLGKIGIPDAILHKRSGLNQEEMDFIKKHELIGVKILEPLKELKDILPWILYHHERWDGSGYPHGLAAEAIPLAAQIIAIADVFDALTTGRDYKTAFSVEEAIREIREKKGAHFNPRLADLMIEIISGMKNI